MQPDRAPERVPHGYEFHDHAPSPASFLQGVVEGLSASRKAIPYRFLYDARGSNLFETICEQPEYYPTRTELRILERHAGEIADLIGPGAHLVELGSGAGRKVRLLLDALEAPASYTAIDISRDALISAVSGLSEDDRDLEIHAVWADYTTRFDLPTSRNGRIVGFFPGSTIGNFERDEARALTGAASKSLSRSAAWIKAVPCLWARAAHSGYMVLAASNGTQITHSENGGVIDKSRDLTFARSMWRQGRVFAAIVFFASASYVIYSIVCRFVGFSRLINADALKFSLVMVAVSIAIMFIAGVTEKIVTRMLGKRDDF